MIETILYALVFILLALAFVVMMLAEHKRDMENIEFEEKIQRMRHQIENLDKEENSGESEREG